MVDRRPTTPLDIWGGGVIGRPVIGANQVKVMTVDDVRLEGCRVLTLNGCYSSGGVRDPLAFIGAES